MTPDNDTLLSQDAEAAARCPVAHVSQEHPTARGGLLRASEVEAGPADSPLAVTVAWVRAFLGKPHPEVGRAGPVCPFVPAALTLDTVWLAEIADPALDEDRLATLLDDYRALFLELDPRSGQASLNKTILIVFPNLGENGAEAVDRVQAAAKPGFVEAGLMLGEFHARNESPGLRNPEFRPLRSPVPMLAMRHMVETDLPFLRRSLDTPEVRTQFLRSYLRRLGTTVRKNFFDQAVSALVEAELEIAARRDVVADAGHVTT